MFSGLLIGTEIGSAAIVLNIDVDTEEFYFTGINSGTIADMAGTNFNYRSALFPTGSGLTAQTIDITSANIFTFTGGAAGSSYLDAQSFGGGSGRIQFGNYPISPEGPYTVTGSGNRASYAGLNAGNKVLFEGLIGSVLTTTISGSGFDETSGVTVAAVPEPANALLFLMGMATAGLRRRRRS